MTHLSFDNKPTPLSLDDVTALLVGLHQLLEAEGRDPAEVEVYTESSGDSFASRYKICDVQIVGGRTGTVKVLLKEMMS